MQVIDGLIAARMFAPASPSTGDTPVWNGTAWVKSSSQKISPSAIGFTGTPTGSKFLRDDNQWVSLPNGGLLLSKRTTTDVVSTASKTDLFGGAFASIAGNSLSSTGRMRIVAGGDYLNNTGANRTIDLELKLGANVLWDSGVSDTIGTTTVRQAWHFVAEIQALSSTSAQIASGLFGMGGNDAATTGLGKIRAPANTGGILFTPFLSVQTATDMTAAEALTLSVTHSASSASLSMRCMYARVEIL